jgi:hypothetical protein
MGQGEEEVPGGSQINERTSRNNAKHEYQYAEARECKQEKGGIGRVAG